MNNGNIATYIFCILVRLIPNETALFRSVMRISIQYAHLPNCINRMVAK